MCVCGGGVCVCLYINLYALVYNRVCVRACVCVSVCVCVCVGGGGGGMCEFVY